MYEFPWTAPALDAVWGFLGAFLRDHGVAAPAGLSRELPLDPMWRSPDLVLGQTCGYPYRHGLSALVELVATPVHAFEGCEGPRHCSFIIARKDDRRAELAAFRGGRAAINGRDSNTGMNLFRAALAPLAGRAPFFAEVAVTGAHAASLAAVASGTSDIAAIDCVTFGLLARGRPALVTRVRVLAHTPSSPGLPFIASLALPAEQRAWVREALFAALKERSLSQAWAALGMVGAEVAAPEAYGRIDELEAGAAAAGYAQLA
jgi:ABC-type phosphate/phosphonate transport system substrate-binding protein